MSDFISWYSIELRSRLAPHLSTVKVESIVREAESHLRESAEHLQLELGLSQESAVLAAIESFGKPDRVALTHLREANVRVFGLKPQTLVLICAIVALASWNFHWLSLGGPFDNWGHTWQNGLAGIVGGSALIGLILGCRAGRRSFRLPLMAIGIKFTIAAVAFTAFWAISSNGYDAIMRPSSGAAAVNLPRYVERLDRVKEFILQGRADFAKARTADDLPAIYRNLRGVESRFDIPKSSSYSSSPHGDGFVVPYSYVLSMPDGRIYAFICEPTFEQAKRRWADADKTSIAQIARERDKLQMLLGKVQEAQSGRLFFFNGFVAVSIACQTVALMLGILLIDTVIFAIVKTRRSYPIRGLA